ncbi:MAG: lysylphosphatidylglycerol synthase transmembrane domain-containing protein [Myxococcota bacterium]|nr:lysylphosphatidylglycerol synthase transmembrane domain-containing protein [Myxococcota bacterium]
MNVESSVGESKSRSLLGWFLKALVALIVTAVALWWSISDVPLDKVKERLFETKWSIVALYLFAQFLVHAIRTIRWGLLVRPLGQPSYRAIFSAASVGIPAAMFLPLRLGEFVRPVMIKRAGVPFASGLASVVVERAVDGLTNVGLFFVLLSQLPANADVPSEIRVGAKIALIIFGGGCGALLMISYIGDKAIDWIHRLLGRFSMSVATKVSELLESFLVGLKSLANPKHALSFIMLTIAYWGVNGFVTALLIQSYGIDVPLLAGPFTVSVLVFAVMVPAGPAFIGPMQAGFRAGLAAYAVSATEALVVGITAHLATVVCFSVILAAGFLAAPKAKNRIPNH